jgi:UDP-3-O-[3-hydroxymyristoyl] glucosamine N-acyltransferase
VKITPHTLSDLAKLLHATYKGNDDHLITGLNEVHLVEAGDLMFVDHPKYYEKALQSAATTILINKEVDCPEGKALIFSDDPFRDYNKLVRHFYPILHSLQLISSTARVGEGSFLYPNVYLGNHVTVGKNCVLMPGVVVHDHCVIGDNVTIHANAVIGSDAFYYKRRSDKHDKMISCGRVVIQDDVEIGSCTSIDRGVSGDTIIGRGTKIDNQVHIGHDVSIGSMCILAAGVGVAGAVKIGNAVTLWGQVGVASAVEIGDGAIVQGQSGVTKSIEGGKVYFGTPIEDARIRMRELAALRLLPDFIDAARTSSK